MNKINNQYISSNITFNNIKIINKSIKNKFVPKFILYLNLFVKFIKIAFPCNFQVIILITINA